MPAKLSICWHSVASPVTRRGASKRNRKQANGTTHCFTSSSQVCSTPQWHMLHHSATVLKTQHSQSRARSFASSSRLATDNHKRAGPRAAQAEGHSIAVRLYTSLRPFLCTPEIYPLRYSGHTCRQPRLQPHIKPWPNVPRPRLHAGQPMCARAKPLHSPARPALLSSAQQSGRSLPGQAHWRLHRYVFVSPCSYSLPRHIIRM